MSRLKTGTILRILVVHAVILLTAAQHGSAALIKTMSWGGSCRAVFPFEQNGNSRIAAGIGTRLVLFDLTDAGTIIERGSVEAGGYVRDIIIDDNTAYIAASDSGMRIIDISNPAQFRTLGSFSYRYACPASIRLAKRKNTVFLADTAAGVFAIDVTNPAALAVKELTNSYNHGFSVLINEDHFFAGGGNDVREYLITENDSFDLKNVGICCKAPSAMAMIDGLVYAGTESGISVLSMALAPTVEGECICRKTSNAVTDCIAEGTRLYVATKDSGIYVFEVIDRTHIEERFHYSEPQPRVWMDVDRDCACRLAKRGNLLYIAYGRLGLIILDCGDGSNAPVKKNTYPAYNYFTSITINDTLAFIGGEHEEIYVMSIANPTVPRLLTTIPIIAYCNDAAIAGGYLYITSSNAGMQIFDIQNPLQAKPVCRATHDTSSMTAHYIDGDALAVKGNTVFLANDNGVDIFDISNKAAPIKISSIGASMGDDVVISNEYLYIAQHGNYDGVYIFDISTIPPPHDASGYFELSLANALHVEGSRIYATVGNRGIQVIDISDKKKPTEVGATIAVPKNAFGSAGWANAIVGDSSTLYITYDSAGIYEVDISHPDKPVYQKLYRLQGGSWSLAKKGDYLYSVGGNGGLQILTHYDSTGVRQKSRHTRHLQQSRNPPVSSCRFLLNGKVVRHTENKARGVHVAPTQSRKDNCPEERSVKINVR